MSAAVSPSVDLQCADGVSAPAGARTDEWVIAALARVPEVRAGDIALRLVAADESRELNHRYRGRDAPTNVLAFPAEVPPGLPPEADTLLGDLVICVPLLREEAAAQGKTPLAHFAHLVVHGTLHLAGLDHGNAAEALHMEALEGEIMRELGFDDPYLVERL